MVWGGIGYYFLFSTMLATHLKFLKLAHHRASSFRLRYNNDSDQSLATLSPSQRDRYKEIREIRPDLNAAAPSDFYQLLCCELGASREEIKSSYKSLLKAVHPDVVGPSANDLAILMNKACEVLLDEGGLRELYEREVEEFRGEEGGFDGQPVSGWMGKEGETRAMFVDETACIGCR